MAVAVQSTEKGRELRKEGRLLDESFYMLVDMEWNSTVSLVLRIHAECCGQDQETKFERVDRVDRYKELASTVFWSGTSLQGASQHSGGGGGGPVCLSELESLH